MHLFLYNLFYLLLDTATPTHEWLNIELGVTEGDDSFFNEPAKYYDCEYKEDLVSSRQTFSLYTNVSRKLILNII